MVPMAPHLQHEINTDYTKKNKHKNELKKKIKKRFLIFH